MYNMAYLESLKNNKVKALELLLKVSKIDINYIERASKDKRFDNIRNLKEFKELISKKKDN